MGCHNCTPSRSGEELNRIRRNTKQFNAKQHYNPNFHVLPPQFAPLARESLEKLYKKILRPYQSKMIPFSTQNSLPSEILELSGQSLDTSAQLQCEVKLAAESLPLSLGNSIFVFLNETDPLNLKVFLTGPLNTPYAHGLFEFEVVLQENGYPLKVKLCTNSNGKVNFSPSLPSSGFVELGNLNCNPLNSQSELGGTPNIPQLLISLRNLFNFAPLFGLKEEPDISEVETREELREYKGYCNTIRYATIKYAMWKYLNNPPPGLKDFIQSYFCLKKDIILKECRKWQTEAQIDNGKYDDIVTQQNPELAAQIRNGAYFARLNKLVGKLEKKLAGTHINEDSAVMDGLKRDHQKGKGDTGTIVTL